MAQKLNLDFSIGESIVKELNNTPEVEKGMVNINETDVAPASSVKDILNTSNETLILEKEHAQSITQNYDNALKSFKEIHEKTLNSINEKIKDDPDNLAKIPLDPAFKQDR